MVISHSTHPVTALHGKFKLTDCQFDNSEHLACLQVAYATESSQQALLSVLKSGGCEYRSARFCCSHD